MRSASTWIIAGLLLSSAFASAARAPKVLDPALTDPAPDAAHPTANKQLLVPSAGVGMNALFMLASGSEAKPTLLLLHGLPGNERNLDLAQAVRRSGWNVLTFTYRGAWGSPGAFSIAHAVEDAAAAMAYLQQPNVAAKYRVDTDRIVVGGHSMGAIAGERSRAQPRGLEPTDISPGAEEVPGAGGVGRPRHRGSKPDTRRCDSQSGRQATHDDALSE